MKRLILMGGRPWVGSDGGNGFVATLFRYFPKEAKLAFCMFAQPKSDWEETRKTNINMFERFSENRSITYETMTAENFVEVSEWADIIYIPGGNSPVLHQKLAAQGDIVKLWNGKVIAGSSAGAVVLCAQYVYLQDKTFNRGLGWVNATCIPHWRDKFEDYTDKDWDWAEEEALKRFPELPALCIPETKFVELSID